MASQYDPTALERLTKHARMAAELQDDSIGDLAREIRGLIGDADDPYLLVGVLAEGAIQAIVQRIPLERRLATTRALIQLLLDRLRVEGATDSEPNDPN